MDMGGVEFVGEADWDALGRDGFGPDWHQLHYILSDYVGSGGSGPADDRGE